MNSPDPNAAMVLDHVALLTPDLSVVAPRLAPLEQGVVETFPGEGTREQYLGDPERPGRVLLMEPCGEGPYARALAKRGPGLHHLGLSVSSLESFVVPRGWLLHPHSLTSRARGTLWLARPGVGALLEVCAGGAPSGPPQVRVEVACEASLAWLLDLGVEGVSRGEHAALAWGEERVEVSALLT